MEVNGVSYPKKLLAYFVPTDHAFSGTVRMIYGDRETEYK